MLGLVLLGLFVSPHRARANGRLGRCDLACPPRRGFSAVGVGLVVSALGSTATCAADTTLVAVVVGIFICTHTRTALAALITTRWSHRAQPARSKVAVRRLFVTGAAQQSRSRRSRLPSTTWLARGQSTQGLDNLTGRTEVWGPLLSFHRDKFQEIFGFGLSNASFNGFPIDSNWLSSYEQQGLFGVVICAIILLFLIVTAYFSRVEYGVRWHSSS